MPVGRSAKRSGADFSRDEHGQRRDGASSDRVAAAALLLSVGNMVPWALCYIRFLRFAFFCRRRDPRLKNGEKGQNGCPRGGGRDGMKKFRDEAGELRLTSGGLERLSIIKAAYTSYKFELAGLWTEN